MLNSMSRNTWLIIIVAVVVVAGLVLAARKPHSQTATAPSSSSVPATASAPLGQRTKDSGCAATGTEQDLACTPGAIIPSATKEQICVPGYSKTVRNVPSSLKQQVFSEYGIASHTKGQYEVDHVVSLELGGSNDIANLSPEAAQPTPGFHQKDAVENYLHQQVCNGSLPLDQAQRQIANDWVSVYNSMPH